MRKSVRFSSSCGVQPKAWRHSLVTFIIKPMKSNFKAGQCESICRGCPEWQPALKACVHPWSMEASSFVSTKKIKTVLVIFFFFSWISGRPVSLLWIKQQRAIVKKLRAPSWGYRKSESGLITRDFEWIY